MASIKPISQLNGEINYSSGEEREGRKRHLLCASHELRE